MSRSRNDQGSFQARVALSRQRSTTSSRPPETCAHSDKEEPGPSGKDKVEFFSAFVGCGKFWCRTVVSVFSPSSSGQYRGSRSLLFCPCRPSSNNKTTAFAIVAMSSCKLLILRRRKRRAAGVMKGHVMKMWRHLALRSPSCCSSSCIEH